MPIIKLRLHFTGSRRRDAQFGALAGLAAWGLGGLLLRPAFKPGWLQEYSTLGLGLSHLGTGCLLFALFAAMVFWLSRRYYTRVFLAALVVSAAVVPPLLGWALLVGYLCFHGQG